MNISKENYEAVLHNFQGTPTNKWEIIRNFIYPWHGIELGNLNQKIITNVQIENSFEHGLPASIKEWIYIAEELQQKEGFSIFRDVFLIKEIAEIHSLSLLIQSEGDLHFVVKKEYLGLEDQPVDIYYFNEENSSFSYYGREAECIADFALLHLIYNLHGKGGGFSIEMTNNTSFMQKMIDSFETHIRIGNFDIFERRNMIATISPSILSERVNFKFEIWKELPMSDIPQCIWEIDRNSGGGFHGMMLPKHLKSSHLK
jgi:hypothetical protein